MQEEHVAKTYTLICRGLDRATILAYAEENGWTETPEEIDQLIESANEELAKNAASVDLNTEFGKAIARLDRLFMDAQKVQDLKTALAVQKEINKLLALKSKPGTASSTTNRTNTGERPRLTIAK